MSQINLNSCRFCSKLVQESGDVLIDEDYQKYYQELTKTELAVNSNLPKMSCCKCRDEIKSAALIKRRVLKSQEELEKYFPQKDDLKENQLMDVDGSGSQLTMQEMRGHEKVKKWLFEAPTFECDKCGEFFQGKNQLKIHFTDAHQFAKEPAEYSCKICKDKKFSSKLGLMKHEKDCLLSKTIQCGKCLKTFRHLSGYHSHMGIAHKDEEEDLNQRGNLIYLKKRTIGTNTTGDLSQLVTDLICSECWKALMETSWYERREKDQYDSVMSVTYCDLCENVFDHSELAHHMEDHQNGVKFYPPKKCGMCEGSFSRTTKCKAYPMD